MHPNVQKLLDLQKVDQKIVSLRRDADSLPAEEARRRKKLEDFERLANEHRDRLTRVEIDVRSMETAIKQSDDEVAKLNERLNIVRNNAEYQATLFQIESVKRDRDQTQEECLKLLEQVDPLRAELTAADEKVDEEKSVFDGFMQEAERVRAETEEKVKDVVAERAELASHVPPDLLGDYERLFATRQGVAVASVEGSFCQGCYNKITTNDKARLMGATTVVHCGSCQRVLYLER